MLCLTSGPSKVLGRPRFRFSSPFTYGSGTPGIRGLKFREALKCRLYWRANFDLNWCGPRKGDRESVKEALKCRRWYSLFRKLSYRPIICIGGGPASLGGRGGVGRGKLWAAWPPGGYRGGTKLLFTTGEISMTSSSSRTRKAGDLDPHSFHSNGKMQGNC